VRSRRWFVEGEREDVRADGFRVVYPLTPLRRSGMVPLTERGEDLDAGIAGVDLQRHVGQRRLLQVVRSRGERERLGEFE
jgi:hypothetical protein